MFLTKEDIYTINMLINKTVKKRSISSIKLKKRLNINKKLGSKDLTSWLFRRYKIKKDDYILEVGCGVGQHINLEKKIIGKKGLILATDISGKSLMNIKNTKNVLTKKIAMENLPKYLSKLDLRFDKIISSYAFYYAHNPIGLLSKLKKFLKINGKFLITAPCYPHTLTEFAKKNKTLSKKAESYINFGVEKLEPYIKKKEKKIFYFKNKLLFKSLDDLINFYRSTVYYKKEKEHILIKQFKNKNKLEVIKSAKLYEFYQ